MSADSIAQRIVSAFSEGKRMAMPAMTSAQLRAVLKRTRAAQ